MESVYIANGINRKNNRAEYDFYATDPKAVEMLLELEKFSQNIWEPACGEGHISNVLKKHGYTVRESDIVDRIDNEVIDFLNQECRWHGDIITNPPYNQAAEFVRKALETVSQGRKIAMFLKLTFLEGKVRRKLFDEYPPKNVYVSSSRISCAKNGNFNDVQNAIAYCWVIWEKGYTGDTKLNWFN